MLGRVLFSFTVLCASIAMLQPVVTSADEKKPAVPKESPAATKSDEQKKEAKGSAEPAGDKGDPLKDDNAPPPVSVVLLQKSLSRLTEKQLLEKIEKAWSIDLSQKEGEENSEGFVVKGGPGFVIKTKDSQYIMMLGRQPYLDPVAADEVEELRLRSVLKAHKTWLSVDFLSGDDELSEAEKKREWKRVASLAAELLDDNTIGVILPEPKVIVAVSDQTARLLREKDPVAALREDNNVPVVNADSEDPEMEKAVAEARKSWPEFVKAFEKQADGTESFGVKFPFDAPENKEFMWVEVTSVDGEFVSGRLANDPVWVKDLKLGSKVKRKVSEIADWMYLKDGKMVGGFSVEVLLKRQAAGQGKE